MSDATVSLDRLWAGWRSSYIEGVDVAPAPDGLPVLRRCSRWTTTRR